MTSGLETFYNPQSWAIILQSNKDVVDSLAAVSAYCNINKLIDNITKSVGEGTSSLVARVGAGLINELPNDYNDYLGAYDDFDRGHALGKAVQVLFNWSI